MRGKLDWDTHTHTHTTEKKSFEAKNGKKEIFVKNCLKASFNTIFSLSHTYSFSSNP